MTRDTEESVPKRRPPSWAAWLPLLAGLMLGGAAAPAAGAPQMQAGSAVAGPNLERSVKAAYLFKFLGYVEFPADPGAALVVGVMAADDVAAEVTRLTAGRTVNGRPVTVRTLRDGDPTTGLQMLFVGAAAERPVQTLRSAAQNGVLTVTDDENGLQQGAIINFRLVEDRIRFEVSLPAAERSNLKLSSRLLSVAYHVQKGN
jgi:YfiR/HmsC-like